MILKINVSAGELLDKISILNIKSENIKDANKLFFIEKEKNILAKEAEKLYNNVNWILKLKDVNYKIWNTENMIREKESAQSFDQDFIELARQVYINNDKRSSIKKQINEYYSSDIVEQKEYSLYN